MAGRRQSIRGLPRVGGDRRAVGLCDIGTMIMHKVAATGVASVFMFFAGSAFADAELFKKANCMACHAIDQKRFGPSMKEVAAKYAGDKSAAETLAKKIQTGSVGVWGQMPMPPQPHVTDADAQKLTEYILSLK